MRIMIVDDEEMLRNHLAGLEEWNALGCEIAGTARNGLEALERIAELKPDLVITDIRMPVMDGIEFTEKLRAAYLDLPVVFLSAYNDFAYAKQAFKLGVTDFITKPVHLEELYDVVETVMQGSRQLNHDDLLVQETVINALLSEDLPTHAKEELLEREGRVQADQRMIVISVEIDNIELLYSMGKPLSQLSLREAVSYTIKYFPYMFWTYMDPRGLFVLLFKPAGEEWDLAGDSMKIANEILEASRRTFDFSVSVGISSLLPSPLDLPQGLKEVRKCFDYRMLLGKQSIISYSAISSLSGTQIGWDEQKLVMLEDMLRRHDAEGIAPHLRSIYREMLSKELNKSFIQHYMMEIVGRAEKVAGEQSSRSEWPDFNEIRKKLLTFDVLADLMKCLETFLLGVIRHVRSCSQDNGSVVVRKLKQYIVENYRDEITLNTLALHLHLNASYLSRLIKRETGQTFSGLLWNHRIEIAKRKLLEDDARASEVAYDVGFKDAAHFSHLFKKIVSVSPGEYRLSGRTRELRESRTQ